VAEARGREEEDVSFLDFFERRRMKNSVFLLNKW
jgi:hypothetical protein